MEFSPAKLRRLREQRGFTRTELAFHLGMSERAILSWELGWRTPSSPSLTLIREILRCRREDLFDEVKAEAAVS